MTSPKQRLYFIDIARSIAILLMLEGHFIDDTLMTLYRDPNNFYYSTWLYLRGFTSPTFLTITGVVFTYLLLGKNDEEFSKNIRVKKGFKRCIELIFWGYLLEYYSFHVLQCIGFGILTILLLYGLYKLVKIIPLWIYFFMAGLIIFSTYAFFAKLQGTTNYWPHNMPSFVQNMFYGKFSVFPILPKMGYTMFGAMFGVILHTFQHKVKSWMFILITFFTGLIIYIYIKDVLLILDASFNTSYYHFYSFDWLYKCLGVVLMFFAFLITVEKLFEIKQSLFLKIGQNTLTIYILHNVLLYGAITGIGIHTFLERKISVWYIIPSTILFLVTFILLIKYLDFFKSKFAFILVPIKTKMNALFGIK